MITYQVLNSNSLIIDLNVARYDITLPYILYVFFLQYQKLQFKNFEKNDEIIIMKLNNLKIKIQKAKNVIVGNRHKAFGDEDEEITTSKMSCNHHKKQRITLKSSKNVEMQNLLEFQ